MITPKELSERLGVTPQAIRKEARHLFGRPSGGWKFTETQVEELTSRLQGVASHSNAVATPVVTREKLTELTQYASNWLEEHYGLTLTVPLEINGRLTRSLGRFVHYRHQRRPKKLELAKRLLQYYPEETIIDVLKHELVHYACYMQGKPHDDGHPYFEGELQRLGISTTGVIPAKGIFHEYTCNQCGSSFQRRNRISPQRVRNSVTRCCHSTFSYTGPVERH